MTHYSLHASCPYCHTSLEDLSISHFSFNSHHGACEVCHGIGFSTTFLEEDIINPRLSLAEGALLPWQNHPYYTLLLEALSRKEGIDLSLPYAELSKKEKEKILYGISGTLEVSYV